jgi:hypothetical protein
VNVLLAPESPQGCLALPRDTKSPHLIKCVLMIGCVAVTSTYDQI